jgi:competence protein ComGC
MKKLINNKAGFTLIEMMVVMLVISVLLAITIPNVTKHNENINKKGCKAFKNMVEAQVQSYEMDKGNYPASMDDLLQEGYLQTGAGNCPGGKTKIVIGTGGLVSEVPITGQ